MGKESNCRDAQQRTVQDINPLNTQQEPALRILGPSAVFRMKQRSLDNFELEIQVGLCQSPTAGWFKGQSGMWPLQLSARVLCININLRECCLRDCFEKSQVEQPGELKLKKCDRR